MFKKNQIAYTKRKIDMSATGGPVIPPGATVDILRVRRDKKHVWVDVINYGQRNLPIDDLTPYRPSNIVGKQYSCRSNALRAIKRFTVKYFASIPRGFQLWVNRIDEGCHEISGAGN